MSEKARCKHLNLNITEYCDAYTEWAVNNGVIEDEGYHNFGDYQNRLDVECYDCGLKTKYNRFGKLPRWLQPYVDKAFIGSVVQKAYLEAQKESHP